MTVRDTRRHGTLTTSSSQIGGLSVKKLTQSTRTPVKPRESVSATKKKKVQAEAQLKKKKAVSSQLAVKKKILAQAQLSRKKFVAAAKKVTKSVSVKRTITRKVASTIKSFKVNPKVIRAQTISAVKSLMNKSKQLKRATAEANLVKLLDTSGVQKALNQQHRTLQTAQLTRAREQVVVSSTQLALSDFTGSSVRKDGVMRSGSSDMSLSATGARNGIGAALTGTNTTAVLKDIINAGVAKETGNLPGLDAQIRYEAPSVGAARVQADRNAGFANAAFSDAGGRQRDAGRFRADPRFAGAEGPVKARQATRTTDGNTALGEALTVHDPARQVAAAQLTTAKGEFATADAARRLAGDTAAGFDASMRAVDTAGAQGNVAGLVSSYEATVKGLTTTGT
jgi:hypothetical protein